MTRDDVRKDFCQIVLRGKPKMKYTKEQMDIMMDGIDSYFEYIDDYVNETFADPVQKKQRLEGTHVKPQWYYDDLDYIEQVTIDQIMELEGKK